ncbi:MAG: LacI family transcriptional regulator [Rhodothermaceae bacterium]|nr:LacI family transcriptional regulator [Rhodothermaceae bacterium]
MNQPTKKKKVTIKDVAKHAKSSMSTVSMVVNGKGYVSDIKRKEVLGAIRQLGYVPSAPARSLASNRTNNIGFILRESHFTLSEPFYTRIFLGAEFEAKNQNYYVLLATVADDYEREADTPRLLKERNVDGIIIAGKVNSELLMEVEDSGIPFVLVDYQYKSYPSITIDNRNGSIEAVRYLMEKGHKDIAFLGSDIRHPSISDRLEGYQLAMLKAGHQDTKSMTFIDEDKSPTLQTGFDLGMRILGGKRKPTAVFCANDALALGLIKYAKQKKLKIPEDLAVVGFDDVEGGKFSTPQLTTVRVFKEQMGELALRLLAELLDDIPTLNSKFERSNHMLTVPAELIIRESA